MPTDDLSRLCLHTVTTKPWPIEQAIDKYAAAGIGGISVWRDAVGDRKLATVGKAIRDSGLTLVSYVRGGFFPAATAEARQQAIEDNLRMIDEAAELGAPLIVLVCGACPGLPLATSRQQILEGIEAILPHAAKRGVRLGIEPLHPMYADSRSAINTLRQANEACEHFRSPHLGVVHDVYHLWWDPDLAVETQRCGDNGNLFAFHICDWKSPTEDLLLDRGIMGEGVIPVREIQDQVEAAGFNGFHEVEIFSTRWWNSDQDEYLQAIITAYRNL